MEESALDYQIDMIAMLNRLFNEREMYHNLKVLKLFLVENPMSSTVIFRCLTNRWQHLCRNMFLKREHYQKDAEHNYMQVDLKLQSTLVCP